MQRVLDAEDLGWGPFWWSSAFTAPVMYLGFWGLLWLFDRAAGVAAAAVDAVLITTAAVFVAVVTHAWKRRIARLLSASGAADVRADATPPSQLATRRGRALLWGEPLQGAERVLVLRDVVRLVVVATALAAICVPVAVLHVVPDGPARSGIEVAAVTSGPIAVVGAGVALVVFARGRR